MLNAAAKSWLRALRSGKFKQTTGVLQNANGYCCLGVACELALKAGIITKKEEQPETKATPAYFTFGSKPESLVLPEKVRLWLGLADNEGHFTTDGAGVSESLTNLNDTGKTFEAIADIIASEPKGLFRKVRPVAAKAAPKKKGKASGKKAQKG
jgi:hypothetical protein